MGTTTTAQPQPANAVRERNDQLCNTGFFTNIAQWYCTEFGDISDEGVGKNLSDSQESTTDSLMSKLNFDSISTTTTTSSSTTTSVVDDANKKGDTKEKKNGINR